MVESTRVRSKRLSFSGKKTLSSFMQVNIASLRQSGKLRTGRGPCHTDCPVSLR